MIQLTFRRGYLGVLAVLSLIALTLYLTFAFPVELFKTRITDTTIIKSVQILVRHGEKAPLPKSYFLEERENLVEPIDGFGQLTLDGKKRMYSLGKFLKLKYYDLLLEGDPNKIYVRSSDVDRCIESASVLVTGLNPPKDRWVWSEELPNWQPIAIHTVPNIDDDLLFPYAPCPEADAEEDRIRNSSIYAQYLSEYKHDLQTLYEYTGNKKIFDDLTQAEIINDALKTRQTMGPEAIPAWYTPAFATRLSHIADKTDQIRFSTATIQRLRSGRLLHEIVHNFRYQIGSGGATVSSGQLERRKVQVYLTHDQTLIALMNSLQIYTGIPNYGTALIIELHYDPVNQVNFLRFFLISSHHPDVIPEPVRVNPPICGVNPECDTMQFEQNVQHLTIDKELWLQACQTQQSTPSAPPAPTPQPVMPIPDPMVVDPMPLPIDQDQAISNVVSPDSVIEGNSIIIPAGDSGLIVGPSVQPITINDNLPVANNVSDEHSQQQEATTIPITISNEPTSSETSTSTPESDQNQPPVAPISSTTTSTPTSTEISELLEPIHLPITDNESNSSEQQQVISPSTSTDAANTLVSETDEEKKGNSGDTDNKLEPQNQIENGIVMNPMLINLIQGGLDNSSPPKSSDTLRRIRPSTVTTRDVYVPMERINIETIDDSSNSQKYKSRISEEN